jgi:hypothetical protein
MEQNMTKAKNRFSKLVTVLNEHRTLPLSFCLFGILTVHADFTVPAKSERIVRNRKILAFLGSLNLRGGGGRGLESMGKMLQNPRSATTVIPT